MNNVEIEISKRGRARTVHRKLPTGYHECDRRTLLSLTILAMFGPTYLAKVSALYLLLGLRIDVFLAIMPEQKVELCALLDWVFATKTQVRNTLGKVRVLWRQYHGPMDYLEDLVFIQYVHAQEFAELYATTGDTKHLDCLVAALFRRRGVAYTLKNVKRKARWLRFLPFYTKLAVFNFFAGCSEYIALEYNECFARETGEQPQKSANKPYTVMQIQIAAHGALGKLEDVQRQNLYTVLETYKFMVNERNPKPQGA